jgi:hypothetical protein
MSAVREGEGGTMSRRTRVALGALLLSIAIVAISASFAFASPSYSVSLSPSRSSVRYGQEFTLQPSVVGTSTYALSTVTIQKSWDGVNWDSEGLEGLKTDGETGTIDPIDPQYMIVDESLLPSVEPLALPHALFFRAIYKPVGIDGKAIPSQNQTSTPTGVTVVFNTKVRASTSVPRRASRKKSFAIFSSMSPNCGIGVMQVTVWKKGFKQRYLLETDDEGRTSMRIKLKKGTYKVQTLWLGNVFGRNAKSATKTVTVR